MPKCELCGNDNAKPCHFCKEIVCEECSEKGCNLKIERDERRKSAILTLLADEGFMKQLGTAISRLLSEEQWIKYDRDKLYPEYYEELGEKALRKAGNIKGGEK
jgi:hypothetical protein